MKFFEKINKSGSAAVVWAVWVFAFIGMFLAVNEARMFHDSRARIKLLDAGMPAEVVASQTPINKDEYEKVQQTIQLMHPRIDVEIAQGRYMEISSRDIGGYYNWIIAIYDAMTVFPEVRWETEEVCTGSGCRGSRPYRIRMKATRVKVQTR